MLRLIYLLNGVHMPWSCVDPSNELLHCLYLTSGLKLATLYRLLSLITLGAWQLRMLDDHNVPAEKVLPRKNICKLVITAGVAGLTQVT